MAMSRKDYRTIALAIYTAKANRLAKAQLARHIGEILVDNHERFDYWLFIETSQYGTEGGRPISVPNNRYLTEALRAATNR